MYIASDYEMSVLYENMAEALVPYCEDFNGDVKIYVELSNIPAKVDESANAQYVQAMSAKLYVEFQNADTIIVLTDEEAIEALDIGSNVFDNPAEWFSENYSEYGYIVSTTNLKEAMDYPDLDPNLYACFRFPKEGVGDFGKFTVNYQNAHKLWQNFIDGNVVSPDAVNYSRS
jgi:hypothetical protein